MNRINDVIVAGHICIDMIPCFLTEGALEEVLSPGQLVNVGPMVSATGGAVPNTGGVLDRFGYKLFQLQKLGKIPLVQQY